MSEPDAYTTLREAAAQVVQPNRVYSVRTRSPNSARLVVLAGKTHVVSGVLQFRRWESGGWVLEGSLECRFLNRGAP